MPNDLRKFNESRARPRQFARLIGLLRSGPQMVKMFFVFVTAAGTLIGLREACKMLLADWDRLKDLRKALSDHAEDIAYAESTVILLMIAAFAVITLHSFLRRAREQHSILFIAPELGGFYAEYLTELVHAARDHADRGLELAITPYVASRAQQRDFCPEQELESIVERMPWISGVFLIPKSPDLNGNQAAICSFHRKRKDKPLVTLDVYPQQQSIKDYPHFVGGDERHGGRVAASRAQLELRKLLKSAPFDRTFDRGIRVLVLVGADSEWERQRQTSFIERLTETHSELAREHPHCDLPLRITQSPPLSYRLEHASQYLRSWRDSLDGDSNPISDPRTYHLIFACNDEMALGAAQALRALSEGGDRASREAAPASTCTKIIGYDGTSRMKLVLELGHDSIKHTVCVNLEDQARRAVQVMSSLISGAQVEPFHKLPPRGWPIGGA